MADRVLAQFGGLKAQFHGLSDAVRAAEAELGAHLDSLPAGLIDRLAAVSEQVRWVESRLAELDQEIVTGGDRDSFTRWLDVLAEREQARAKGWETALPKMKVKAKRKAAEKVY